MEAPRQKPLVPAGHAQNAVKRCQDAGRLAGDSEERLRGGGCGDRQCYGCGGSACCGCRELASGSLNAVRHGCRRGVVDARGPKGLAIAEPTPRHPTQAAL
jgi:hypothetical protein